MRSFENYFEPPLEGLVVGKDSQVRFYESHLNSLMQAVANGAPFADLITPTQTAFTNLKESWSGTTIHLARQEAKTLAVDNLIELIKQTLSKREAAVLYKVDKTSVEYREFYPNGKMEYSTASKSNIEALLDQFISAANNHKAITGDALYTEVNALRTQYVAARATQLQQKENTSDKRSSWDELLPVMKGQIFYNLLSIAREYLGQPEKARLYFDQSILTPRVHAKPGDANGAYKLSVPAATTLAADISFSVDATLLLRNTGDVVLYYFGAATAGASAQDEGPELLPDAEVEVTASQLGAPGNKFLLFKNNDPAFEGEVEIVLI
jgi:hypothetical protein